MVRFLPYPMLFNTISVTTRIYILLCHFFFFSCFVDSYDLLTNSSWHHSWLFFILFSMYLDNQIHIGIENNSLTLVFLGEYLNKQKEKRSDCINSLVGLFFNNVSNPLHRCKLNTYPTLHLMMLKSFTNRICDNTNTHLLILHHCAEQCWCRMFVLWKEICASVICL